jgi:hypothetical protein
VKLLIMGAFSDKKSTVWGVAEGLEACGHTYVPLEIKTGSVSPKSPKFVDHVVRQAEQNNVDTVLICKGTIIPLGTYKSLVSRLPDTTYLTFDSVSGKGCGPPGRPEEIGPRGLLCDRIICTGSEGARWWRNHGYRGRIAQIYQGCRHSIWRPDNLDAVRTHPNQIAFLGSTNYTGDGGRRAKIEALTHNSFKLHTGKRTFHQEAANLYYNNGICLNMVCGTPGEGPTPVGITSNRLVRLLTSGGFALTERNTDVAASFEEGNQLATYNFGDIPDLLEKARYWRANQKERLEIAKRGWEWSANWSWDQQTDKMTKFIAGEDVLADGAATPWVGTLRE